MKANSSSTKTSFGRGLLGKKEVKSLKKLQREDRDAMQHIIDDYQSIVDILLEKLNEKGGVRHIKKNK